MKQSVEAQSPADQLNSVATTFIKTANEYASYIVISRGGNRVNAKSLLGFLSLGMSSGSPVELSAEGSDAAEALAALGRILAGPN